MRPSTSTAHRTRLYVILDIFSRCVVGWMIAGWESAELAEALIADSCGNHAIVPGQLTLHADRGASMRSKPVADLLADLPGRHQEPQQALRFRRQPILGIAFQDHEIPAQLPGPVPLD